MKKKDLSKITICPECGKECSIIEQDDSFAYSGTHCTGGKSGTHQMPTYVISDCCEAEVKDYGNIL